MMRQLFLATAACVLVAAPASSQTDPESAQDRAVTVRLEQVLEPMAAALDLPGVLLPETVDVPETLATEVCGVNAGELAAQGGEQASCTAIGRSPELTRFVQEEMVVSGRPVDAATIDEDPDQTPDFAESEPSLPGTAGDVLSEPGDPEPEEAPEPSVTGTSPGVNGDDPLEAAPSDIREPADQLPNLGQDTRPSPSPGPPPATTAPGQTGTVPPATATD